jgi:hypothetical protein
VAVAALKRIKTTSSKRADETLTEIIGRLRESVLPIAIYSKYQFKDSATEQKHLYELAPGLHLTEYP